MAGKTLETGFPPREKRIGDGLNIPRSAWGAGPLLDSSTREAEAGKSVSSRTTLSTSEF